MAVLAGASQRIEDAARQVLLAKEPYSAMRLVGSGCECKVFEVSPKLYLKTFHLAEQRDRAHIRQKQACIAGFAPPTRGVRDYQDFAVSSAKGFLRFGYLTCVATVDTALDAWDGTRITENKKLVESLKKKMDALGFWTNDLHPGNVGRYKGKPVVIDFGDESTKPF